MFTVSGVSITTTPLAGTFTAVNGIPFFFNSSSALSRSSLVIFRITSSTLTCITRCVPPFNRDRGGCSARFCLSFSLEEIARSAAVPFGLVPGPEHYDQAQRGDYRDNDAAYTKILLIIYFFSSAAGASCKPEIVRPGDFDSDDGVF